MRLPAGGGLVGSDRWRVRVVVPVVIGLSQRCPIRPRNPCLTGRHLLPCSQVLDRQDHPNVGWPVGGTAARHDQVGLGGSRVARRGPRSPADLWRRGIAVAANPSVRPVPRSGGRRPRHWPAPTVIEGSMARGQVEPGRVEPGPVEPGRVDSVIAPSAVPAAPSSAGRSQRQDTLSMRCRRMDSYQSVLSVVMVRHASSARSCRRVSVSA